MMHRPLCGGKRGREMGENKGMEGERGVGWGREGSGGKVRIGL